MSISGGVIQLNGAASTGSDPAAIGGPFSRVAGRTFLLSRKKTTTDVDSGSFGFTIYNTINTWCLHGFMHTTSAWIVRTGSYGVHAAPGVVGTWYDFAMVLRNAGCLYFVRTQGLPWKLVYVDGVYTNSSLYVGFGTRGNTVDTPQYDNLRVIDLVGLWAQPWGVAFARVPSAGAGEVISGAAHGVVEITITAQTGVIQELKVRYTDKERPGPAELLSLRARLSRLGLKVGSVDESMTREDIVREIIQQCRLLRRSKP